MANGADNSGDDLVVGRTNRSEERTILVAQNGDHADNGYAEDFVLSVSTVGDKVLPTNSHGVDAIHAKGTISFPTGGAIGTIPAANGVVGQGLNGIVGYVHPALRDKDAEQDSHAGVLGIGAPNDAGVLGKGLNGVVGYEQNTSRDSAFETQEMAGVLGVGPNGVSGKATGGFGVHGIGTPGVFGEAQDDSNTGVVGQGGTGVFGESLSDGAGIQGTSKKGWGAVFESRDRAQVWLVPIALADPTKLPGRCAAGELVVVMSKDQRGKEVASLWFCKSGDIAKTANWIPVA
jgi:hypothetical protein